MTLRISGKSISVSETLRGRVSERTDEVLRKYFDGNYSGHVTLSKDGFGFKTDCALHLDSGITLEAESNAADAYASADQALLMIEKRLRRYKSRLKDRSARKTHAANAALAGLDGEVLDAPSYVIEAPAEGDEEITGYNPVIIAENTTALKRLSVSEAVLELDLSGAPCMVFQHGSSGRVNIIYRRADGNIGWVDPPAVKP
ncbi:ribosome hibernation-promoting factor, HPF/YfiA family [Bradyrhizobium sp. HKCCYLR20261]|uniref:ribosome hibernation-promoting factor, HPF/YfiA family n=1 Tax=Bradyrhizobium sp. HKCCYLR20261 TaxID=3420760 RepID=UPI003EB988D2